MSYDSVNRFIYVYDHEMNPHPWLTRKVVNVSLGIEPLPRNVLDLGCGNGAGTRLLVNAGFCVTGCDPEETAVAISRREIPDVHFEQIGVYDDPGHLGLERFDLVIAVDVVEHLFLPRALPCFVSKVLRPGGHFILTTPHYGHYFKNLVCSLLGRWDHQFAALWDGGHVKFWSLQTITVLLEEAGFRIVAVESGNRISPLLRFLWPNNMIVLAQKTPQL